MKMTWLSKKPFGNWLLITIYNWRWKLFHFPPKYRQTVLVNILLMTSYWQQPEFTWGGEKMNIGKLASSPAESRRRGAHLVTTTGSGKYLGIQLSLAQFLISASLRVSLFFSLYWAVFSPSPCTQKRVPRLQLPRLHPLGHVHRQTLMSSLWVPPPRY